MENSLLYDFRRHKLPIKTLERLLKRNKIKDPGVIVGPGIGEDAACYRHGRPPLFARQNRSHYLHRRSNRLVRSPYQRQRYRDHGRTALCTSLRCCYLKTLRPRNLAEKIFRDTMKACKSIGVEPHRWAH